MKDVLVFFFSPGDFEVGPFYSLTFDKNNTEVTLSDIISDKNIVLTM